MRHPVRPYKKAFFHLMHCCLYNFFLLNFKFLGEPWKYLVITPDKRSKYFWNVLPKLTFRDPQSSTVSASFTTFTLKYSVWNRSFSTAPCSSTLQPDLNVIYCKVGLLYLGSSVIPFHEVPSTSVLKSALDKPRGGWEVPSPLHGLFWSVPLDRVWFFTSLS